MPKSKNRSKEEKQAAKLEKRRRSSFWRAFYAQREKVWGERRERVRLHQSFKRSYREDYVRGLKAPGLVSHARMTMRIIRKNWKIFGALIIFTTVANILLVGLMSESTYETYQETLTMTYQDNTGKETDNLVLSALTLISTVTTGGLTNDMSDVQRVFLFFFIAIDWLVTIYIVRHLLAGNKVTFRESIYNSLAPLISTIVGIFILLIYCIPFMLFMVLFSTAKQTGFLTQPLYAFVFWVFSLLLILLSCYLAPGALFGLVATTVPGIYPIPAIRAATDLVQGRRTAIIIRVVFALVYLAVFWVILMLPLGWLDLVLREHFAFLENVPVMPFIMQLMTSFSIIFATAYIYLFYRRVLDNDD